MGADRVGSERGPVVRVVPLFLTAGSLTALALLAPAGLLLLGFLGVIIGIHEGGHFVSARRAGMRPTQLYWGFGPEIASIRVGDCRYGLRALWLGGYVRLEGMTPGARLPDGFDEVGAYRSASHGGRLATVLAGPAVNLASALLAFVGAGLVDGRGLGPSVLGAARQLWGVVDATAWSLWTLAANLGAYVGAVLDPSGATEAPVRFLSPVAQAQTSELAISLGPAGALRWFGILSAAIGIINLLPLPPLDGGHAVVAGAEWAGRRLRRDRSLTLDANRLNPLAWLTVVVLMTLSLSALVLDLRGLA